MNNFVETNIPAWYKLGWKSPKRLLISVHVVACKNEIKKILDDKEVFVLCKSTEKNWLMYEFCLPLFTEETASLRLRLSLSDLFACLLNFDGNTNYDRPQLIIIDEFRNQSRVYGGFLRATLTPTVSKWLSKQKDDLRLFEVEEAMISTSNHVWPDGVSVSQFSRGFSVLCRQPKWINFTVPGNSCGLDPSDYYDKSLDKGYVLFPHNTDTFLQQISLLAGLAKLESLIRKDFATHS